MKQRYYYVAIIRGVYRHNILGVYDSSRNARQAAWIYFSRSGDHYHDVEVVRRRPNTLEHWQDPEYGWVYTLTKNTDGEFKVSHTKFGELDVS